MDDVIWFICLSNPSCYLFVQIAREIVISAANSRLGVTALTKGVGLIDRPDSPYGELIKYSVYSTFIPCLSFSPSCLVDYFLHISLLCNFFHSYMGVFNMTETIMGLNAC